MRFIEENIIFIDDFCYLYTIGLKGDQSFQTD